MIGGATVTDASVVLGTIGIITAAYILITSIGLETGRWFVQLTAIGLLTLAISGPLEHLVPPAVSHAVHGIAALIIAAGLVACIIEMNHTSPETT